MPWLVVSEDGKHCVHKKNADGTAGDKMKCYTDEAEAKAYVKALYANNDYAITPESLVEMGGLSLDKWLETIRDTFYKTHPMNAPQAQENDMGPSPYIREIFDGYIVCEFGPDLYKIDFTIEDEKIIFAAKENWQKVKQEYVSMVADFFLTVELAAEPEITMIDGMAASDDHAFVSMIGKEVFIPSADLQLIMKNTQAVIESTKTEKGEIVGLPIDMDKHNHEGGAGWIVGLEMDTVRNVIRFAVKWTQDGIDLIKANTRRFFSPSIDMMNKTILGGSLTNWPATRNDKGEMLLRPVELSLSIKEFDMEKTLLEILTALPGQVAEAVRGKPKETQLSQSVETEGVPLTLSELLNTPEAVEELGKIAQKRADEFIEVEKRKARAIEFASKLATGTRERPIGLGVPARDAVNLLLSLPAKQSQAVERILAKAYEGAVDFAIHGLDSDGMIRRPELPKIIQTYARQWVDAGKPIKEFFTENPELGNASDYNLAEFITKKDG